MILPFEQYFDGIVEKVKVFKMEYLQECIDYLEKDFAIKVTNYKCNTSHHDLYTQYYNADTQKKVEEIYAWELQNFHYKFGL
jgi:hypothetical protein